MDAHQRLSAEGRQLRLVILKPVLLRIFVVTCLQSMFTTFSSIQDALGKSSRASRRGSATQLPRTTKT